MWQNMNRNHTGRKHFYLFRFSKLYRLPRWHSGKESACQCRRYRRHVFDPWVRKIPWRRAWQPTPIFLPGESHGQRSLVSYSPLGRKESNMTEATQHAHTTPASGVYIPCIYCQLYFFPSLSKFCFLGWPTRVRDLFSECLIKVLSKNKRIIKH